MVSALGLTLICRTPATLGLSPIHYIFVEYCWWERAVPALGFTLVDRTPIALGLPSLCYIPTAIGLSFVLCVLTTIGLSSVHCEVGACCPPIVSFLSMLVGTKLSSCRSSWFLGDPTCCDVCGHDFLASRIFEVLTLLMVECFLLWGCSAIGSLARANILDIC